MIFRCVVRHVTRIFEWLVSIDAKCNCKTMSVGFFIPVLLLTFTISTFWLICAGTFQKFKLGLKRKKQLLQLCQNTVFHLKLSCNNSIVILNWKTENKRVTRILLSHCVNIEMHFSSGITGFRRTHPAIQGTFSMEHIFQPVSIDARNWRMVNHENLRKSSLLSFFFRSF